MNETTGCAKCNYTGYLHVEDDDTRVAQCLCAYAKKLKAYLGPEISAAPTITRSPLYALGARGEPPAIDRMGDNLFIKSYWTDLLPHLKWALACRGPMYRYRIVTDEKIRTVFVGNDSYRQRSKADRDEVVTFNGLGDLVGPDLDLVIIRLGFLGYKNISMPGALKEALMIRESAAKPTWLVEVPSSPYGPGHFSYNEDVGGYIERLFEVVDLVRERVERDTPHGYDVGQEEPVEDVGMGAHTSDPEPVRKPVERFKASPTVETPDMGALLGDDSRKRFKKFGGKKRGGGGGPI
jgi:hypothetical protein